MPPATRRHVAGAGLECGQPSSVAHFELVYVDRGGHHVRTVTNDWGRGNPPRLLWQCGNADTSPGGCSAGKSAPQQQQLRSGAGSASRSVSQSGKHGETRRQDSRHAVSKSSSGRMHE
eukprot:GHVU01178490.1.p1 GENE.GHVU01178490.1~~GHVU01178490.1.p1  ORF type:complete len:118 (+),score=10.05 GHVU01178490.1:206-559(+)